ncbi:hypothetical protein GQ457_11G009140 [Hibiscus cannabinus]
MEEDDVGEIKEEGQDYTELEETMEKAIEEELEISINALTGNIGWTKEGVEVISTNPLVITVANGEKLYSSAKSKQLQWRMQRHQFVHDFRVLSMGGSDMILVDSASDPQRWKNALIHFIAQNLVTNVPGGQTSQNAVKYPDKEDYAHLLDWFRAEHLTGNEVKRESSRIGKMFMSCGEGRRHKKTVRRIKKLKESGIRVKPSKTRTITNISFYCNFKGEVTMPHLWVDCSTASKLMNLVALEMCGDFHNGYEVIAYLCFMDSLIDTPEDVKELEDTGVLHNNLGTDEAVAHLFNELASDLPAHPGPSVYQDVVNHIHKLTIYHYNSLFFLSRSPRFSRENMANAASGMAVHDDCKLKFLELKAKRTYRFIVFKIEEKQKQVVVEKLGEPTDSYEAFTASLPADECRYAVYDFDFVTSENCQKSRIFFIAWSPDTSKVRSKMIYASSKDRFKRELDGIQVELQATDPTEMGLDVIRSRAN